MTVEPIWMVTDGCATRVSGVVSQGVNWQMSKVAAFYLAKLNSAQQNYPVHEIELLAGSIQLNTCGITSREGSMSMKFLQRVFMSYGIEWRRSGKLYPKMWCRI